MVKYSYKTPTKGNESMNSSKTMAILQKLIKIKYQKKKKENQDQSQNFLSKIITLQKNFTYFVYSDNTIRNKNEIQNTSEREFNNVNDKSSNNEKRY